MRLLLSFCLLLATLYAAWAALAELLACPSCDSAADLVGNFPLAPIGTLFYAGLFLLSLFRPRPIFLLVPLLLAALMHLILLTLLVYAGLACTPCLLTALSCGAAAGTAVQLQRHAV